MSVVLQSRLLHKLLSFYSVRWPGSLPTHGGSQDPLDVHCRRLTTQCCAWQRQSGPAESRTDAPCTSANTFDISQACVSCLLRSGSYELTICIRDLFLCGMLKQVPSVVLSPSTHAFSHGLSEQRRYEKAERKPFLTNEDHTIYRPRMEDET